MMNVGCEVVASQLASQLVARVLLGCCPRVKVVVMVFLE